VLSTSKSGKPFLLESKTDKTDKRRINYSLSQYGLYILYVNFLRVKYLEPEFEHQNELWYSNVTGTFNRISFDNCFLRKSS